VAAGRLQRGRGVHVGDFKPSYNPLGCWCSRLHEIQAGSFAARDKADGDEAGTGLGGCTGSLGSFATTTACGPACAENPLGFRVDRQVLNSFLQTPNELWLGIISPAARFHGAWSTCSKAMSAGSYWSARARKEGPGRGWARRD
jgi:hypothetical protein